MTKTNIRKRWQRMTPAGFDSSAAKTIISKTVGDVGVIVRWHLTCTSHDRLRCHLAGYVGRAVMPGCRFPSDTTFLNVNGCRYVGKVVPEQIDVGSLFRNSNVNGA